MVFSELKSLVQMARFAIEQTQVPYLAARMKKNPLDIVTPSESGDRADSTTENDEDESAVLHTQNGIPRSNGDENPVPLTQEDVATINLDGRITTQISHNGSIVNRTKLDVDERDGSRHLTETFESLRNNMAMAWNKAMILELGNNANRPTGTSSSHLLLQDV